MGLLKTLIISIIVYMLLRLHEVITARKRVEKVRKPNERVQSYNATVLIDNNGEISWIDNDRKIDVMRAKK